MIIGLSNPKIIKKTKLRYKRNMSHTSELQDAYEKEPPQPKTNPQRQTSMLSVF